MQLSATNIVSLTPYSSVRCSDAALDAEEERSLISNNAFLEVFFAAFDSVELLDWTLSHLLIDSVCIVNPLTEGVVRFYPRTIFLQRIGLNDERNDLDRSSVHQYCQFSLSPGLVVA